MHAYSMAFESKLRAAGARRELIESYLLTVRQSSLERMRALCRAAGLPERVTSLFTAHGDALERILKLAQDHHCDLIVMGRRGLSSDLEYLLIGGVTRHVLGQSKVDVLISTASESIG